MPPVIPNPDNIHEFASEADFERWLATHHATASEIWITVHKKGSGLTTITTTQALDVALCWGWIDAIRKSLNETSFLQRYTPRTKKSIWSIINTGHVARLIKAKRMQVPGHAQIDAAKSDGRWENAYSGSAAMKIHGDLAAALKNNKTAQAMYDTLTSQNRYALSFRIGNVKTEATRIRKVAEYVAMLERGETFYPNKAAKTVEKQPAKNVVSHSAKNVVHQPMKKVAKKPVTKKTITKKRAR